MDHIKEGYTPKVLAASGQIFSGQGFLAGFTCTTAGTLQLGEGSSAAGADVLASMPVTAGLYYPLPLNMANGLYATLGGGAAGTFYYSV